MGNGITGLDHAIVKAGNVDDLNALRAFMTRLGFTYAQRLDARGYYSDRIIFENNYFALIGIADQDLLLRKTAEHHRVAPTGISKIHLQSWDAGASTMHLAGAGLPVMIYKFFIRLELPEIPGGGADTAHWIMELDSIALPTLRFTVCHHLMPELIWRREWMAHANGARNIVRITIAANDPTGLVSRYGDLFGEGACQQAGATLVCKTPGCEFVFIEPQTTARHQDSFGAPATEPTVVGVTIAVGDLAAMRARLDPYGIGFSSNGDGSIAVAWDRLPNLSFEFRQAADPAPPAAGAI